jgi:hypothetical protein
LHGEVLAQPQEADGVTVQARIDRRVGLQFRYQVGPYGVVLKFAARTPAGAEASPVPGVIGVGRMQMLCEAAAYNGGQGCVVRAISRRLPTAS